jgi:hypothetical protein
MIKRRTALLFIILLAASVTGGNVVSRYPGEPNSNHLTNAAALGITRNLRNSAALPLPLASPRILVKKAERKLFLYSGSTLVRTYRIGLGLSPLGDKVRQGDRRTPEGDFYIFTKNDQSAFYLSLGISYPNAAHAERGLRDKLITKSHTTPSCRRSTRTKLRRRTRNSAATFTFMVTARAAIGPGGASLWRMKTFANYSMPSPWEHR